MRRNRSLSLLLVCVTLTAPMPRAVLAAGLDGVDLSRREARNLRPLAALFRHRSRALPGELGEVRDLLDDAASSAAEAETLRQLVPDLARLRAITQSRSAARLAVRRAGRIAPRHRSPAAVSAHPSFPLAAVEPEPLTNVWLQTTWDDAEQDDRDGVGGFESEAGGWLVGLDRQVGARLTFGIAAGGSRADVTSASGDDDVDADDYLGYSIVTIGDHRVDFLIAVRDSTVDRSRVLTLPRGESVRQVRLTSTLDTDERQVSAAWSYDRAFGGGWYLTPGLGLTHVTTSTDDYVESGGGNLGLAVETDDETQLVVDASLAFGRMLQAGAWSVAPEALLSVEHALEADATVTRSTFNGTRFGFTSRGYSVEKTRLTGALTLSAVHATGFGLSVGVTHERQDDYRYTALTATAGMTF